MSFFGGLWDSFTGKAQADAIKEGTAQANAEVKRGTENAAGLRKDYFNQGMGYLQPRLQSGQDAEKRYRDAIGLNGPDAQRAYYADFQHEPGYEAELNAGIKAIDRSAASRGMLRSGQNVNAIADAGRRWANTAYNNRLGQYANMFTRGDQASNLAFAGTNQLGDNLAGDQLNQSNALAGNAINQANALAAAKNTPWNNIIGLGGLLVGGFTPNKTGNTAFGNMGNALNNIWR